MRFVALFIVLLVFGCTSLNQKSMQLTAKHINYKWQFKSYASQNAAFQVAYLHNNVYIANQNGHIDVVDDVTGKLVKQINLHTTLSSGIVMYNESIVATTADMKLISLNSVSGVIAWEAALPNLTIEPPQISNGIIVVKTNNANIVAYNADDGALLWEFHGTDPLLSVRSYSDFSVLHGDNLIVTSLPLGKLALLNLDNGGLIWDMTVIDAAGVTVLDKLTDVISGPILDDNKIYVNTFNGYIVCIDAMSHNILWKLNAQATHNILVDKEHVYTVSEDGLLSAIDKADGKYLWHNNMLRGHQVSDIIFFDKDILIVDSTGSISLFNYSNGNLIASQSSRLSNQVTFYVLSINDIIIQSNNGHLVHLTN